MIANNIRKLGILLALSAVMLLAVALLAVSYSDIGVAGEYGNVSLELAGDIASVPQSVADDAARLAEQMFGSSRDRYQAFVGQLLESYINAEGKDVVVVFNPGGWGWSSPEQSSGWNSILNGIGEELDSLGYRSVVVNYRRSSETFLGGVKEFIEIVYRYPSKAEGLAQRVTFLTQHNPDLKVIVAGESNGTLISDGVMNILQENQRVYSIQTGSPFWYRQQVLERTLLLNDNGVVPDAFSRGDIPTMVWATVKGWLGIPAPEMEPGQVMHFLRAPGHDYSWQYPQVYGQIVQFLQSNFGEKPKL